MLNALHQYMILGSDCKTLAVHNIKYYLVSIQVVEVNSFLPWLAGERINPIPQASCWKRVEEFVGRFRLERSFDRFAYFR